MQSKPPLSTLDLISGAVIALVSLVVLTLAVIVSVVALSGEAQAAMPLGVERSSRPPALLDRPLPTVAVELSGTIDGVPLEGLVLMIRGTFADGQRCDFDVTLGKDGRASEVAVLPGTDPSRIAALYPGVPVALQGTE